MWIARFPVLMWLWLRFLLNCRLQRLQRLIDRHLVVALHQHTWFRHLYCLQSICIKFWDGWYYEPMPWFSFYMLSASSLTSSARTNNRLRGFYVINSTERPNRLPNAQRWVLCCIALSIQSLVLDRLHLDSFLGIFGFIFTTLKLLTLEL